MFDMLVCKKRWFLRLFVTSSLEGKESRLMAAEDKNEISFTHKMGLVPMNRLRSLPAWHNNVCRSSYMQRVARSSNQLFFEHT